MKKIAIFIILVILAGAAYFFATRGNKNNQAPPLANNEKQNLNSLVPAPGFTNALEKEVANSPTADNQPPAPITNNDGGDDQNNIQPLKTFSIAGENFKFSLSEIRVKKGDRVRINFNSASGFHDWKVDEFKAATKQLNTGQSDSIEFTANTSGTFEYYCSVGQHRAMGMVGKLIVE